ncbi:hypothetical protein [Halobacterium salinarum]|uniref:hypothetical protein n=1 Tax=Halobacterium salinarum TaxID=2242 RepID=UPI002555A749|nr:hypothetical protein [Halobacterium salinarum]MDL0133519.1 hypothetical protein [Halobacterium salinarum]
MIDNYQECNRDETLDAVSDFSTDRLEDFLAFERAHKNRKTVVEPIERMLVDVVPVDQSTQYVAGVWFDDPTQPTTVRRSRRIKAALAADELQEVE